MDWKCSSWARASRWKMADHLAMSWNWRSGKTSFMSFLGELGSGCLGAAHCWLALFGQDLRVASTWEMKEDVQRSGEIPTTSIWIETTAFEFYLAVIPCHSNGSFAESVALASCWEQI